MRFHALLPVRDEADIIRESLAALLQWADAIYIFDTGSVDDTWQIIGSIARAEPKIVLLGSEPIYYNENLVRGYIFDRARHQMDDGDWVLRADADEFHHVPPPVFAGTCIQRHETMVWHQYYDFCLTEAEVANWDDTQELKRPIADRRRYFKVSTYSEPRMFRYRSTMRWSGYRSQPANAGYVAYRRMPIRHYPHRSPEQLRRRSHLRAIMMAAEANRRVFGSAAIGHHWNIADWRKFVVSDSDPDMRYWSPGTALPAIDQTNHLQPWPTRIAQRVVHAVALPILDRTRVPFGDSAPLKIPPDVQDALARALSPQS